MADTLPPVVARLVADTGSFVRDMAEARAAAEAAMRGIRDASSRDLPRFSGELRNAERELPRFTGDLRDTDTALRTMGSTAERESKRTTTAVSGMGVKTQAILGGIALGAPVIGAAITAGVGAGFIGLAALAQHNNAQVQSSFEALKSDVISQTKDMTAGMVGPLTDGIDSLRSTFDSLAPSLSQVFTNVTPDIALLTDGIDRLARNAMPGLVDITRSSQDVFRGLDNLLASAGQGLGDFMSILSQHSAQFGQAFTELGTVLHEVLDLTGSVTSALAGLSGGALSALSGALQVAVPLVDGLLNALGPLTPIIGEVATGLFGASKAAKLFGTSLKGIAFGEAVSGTAAMGTAAETAATGALSLRGKLFRLGTTIGPLGIAVGALAYGLGQLGPSETIAGRDAAALTGNLQALKSALHGSHGAIDANVRSATQLIAKNAGLISSAQSVGVSTHSIVSALLGVPGAGDKVMATLNGMINNNGKFEKSLGRAGYAMGLEGQKAGVTKKELQDLKSKIGPVIHAQDLLTKSQEKGTVTGSHLTTTSQTVASAFSDLAGGAHTAAQASKDLLTIMGNLNGGFQSAFAADAQFYSGLDSLKQQLKSAKGPILDTTGALNAQSQAGRDVGQFLQTTQKSWTNYATSQLAAGKSAKDVTKHLQDERGAVITMAENMGLSAKQANRLADKFGLIPKRVVTAITQPGMAKAQAEADVLRNKVLAVPNSHTIETTALTQTSLNRLHGLGLTTKRLPDGNFLVTANTAGALNGVLGVLGAENSLYDKSVTISTYHRDFHTAIYRSRYLNSIGSRGYGIAGGGILKPFAGGGFYDGHPLTPMSGGLAQMVPPRTFRVIGDNLRVPEAYIPIEPGSQRSQELLSRTNKLMGRMTVAATKGGTPVAATASVPRASASTGGASPHVTIVVQGSVVTERRLIDVVQQGMLEMGARRPQSYQQGRR